MKAVVYERYGDPEVLRLTEVPDPVPGPDEVLIRVESTSINLSDVESLHGSPLYARVAGLRRPRRPILGSDIAGRVVGVGRRVDAYRPGDAVAFADAVERRSMQMHLEELLAQERVVECEPGRFHAL